MDESVTTCMEMASLADEWGVRERESPPSCSNPTNACLCFLSLHRVVSYRILLTVKPEFLCCA